MSRNKTGGVGAAVGRPPEVLAVLKEPPDTRKEFYRAYRAAHRNILATAEELLRLIREPAGAEVIYLIGPTGVGKTTLTEHVIARLNEMALPLMDKFPGRVPAAYLEAESPDKGSYEWGKHYKNTMLALDEVLIDKKVYLPGPRDTQDRLVLPQNRETRRQSALRSAAENTLMNRIIYAFFIDEAQYITKRRSGEGLIDQADTIRSLAARSKTLHVLAGTYDLRLLRNLSGQLARRSHTVHFWRYKIEDLTGKEKEEELKEFTKAFLSLQTYLPVNEQPDLIKHIDFCFERTLGCVGHLKSWFQRSLSKALDDNLETVNSELFLKAATPKEVWRQMAQEIADGESALEETDDELDAELAKVGRVTSSGPPQGKSGDRKSGNRGETTAKKGNSMKSKKGGKPFTPKPERYPVGV